MGLLSTQEEAGLLSPLAAVLATVASHVSSLLRMDPTFDMKLFRDFWMSMDTPLAIVGPSGLPLLVNRRMEQFLQYSEPELQRMHFLEFTHPQDKEIDKRMFDELLAGSRTSYFISKRWITKTGSIVQGLLTVTGIVDETGKLTAVSAVVQPILTSSTNGDTSTHHVKSESQLGLHSSKLPENALPANDVADTPASGEPVWKGGNSLGGILRELALIRRPVPVVLAAGLFMFFVWLFAGGGIHEVIELIKHLKG